MTTYSAKPETVKRDWYIVDASGKVLGRLASEIARRLKGKHKPEFTTHVDTGDYVIVVNAEKIVVTGKKTKDKLYHRYTGYQSGLQGGEFRRAAQACAGPGNRRSRARHVAEESFGASDVPQAQGI